MFQAFFVRQQQETAKVREVLILQDVIARFADLNVCKDFSNGENGACKLDEKDLKFLEKFPKYVQPKRPDYSNETSFIVSSKTAAEHLSNVIDGRQRPFLDSGYSYEQVKELFDKILQSGYFEKDIQQVAEDPVEVNESSENAQEKVAAMVENHVGDMEKVPSGESVVPVEEMKPKLEPPPASQVPAPAFPIQSTHSPHPQQQTTSLPVPNAVQQQQQLFQGIPMQQNAPNNATTTVKAVENAYYKHHQYISQQQPPIQEVIGSGAGFFFLQDSEIENEGSAVNAQSTALITNSSQQQIQSHPANVMGQQSQQAQSNNNIPANISPQVYAGQNYYNQQPSQAPVPVASQTPNSQQVVSAGQMPPKQMEPQTQTQNIPNYPNSQVNQIPPQTYPPSSHFPPVQHFQPNSIQSTVQHPSKFLLQI